MSHKSFIQAPIHVILEDMVSATSGIGVGIETYPVCDYVMQSVFLKMTSAQEQKMKCICWELASYDYEYRYQRFTRNRLGECSTIKEKTAVYKDLINQINEHGDTKFNTNSLDKQAMIAQTKDLLTRTFFNSNLSLWGQRSFNEFHQIWSGVTERNIAINDKLLSNTGGLALENVYTNHLYKHRNRTAHNVLSYQQNLPTFRSLIMDDHKYENYFVYFSILILIDEVVRSLYNNYLEILQEL